MRKHVTIADNIDQKETAANVAALLANYSEMKHLATASDQLQGQTYDSILSDSRNLHAGEDSIQRKIDAQNFIDACDEALFYVRSMIGEREADAVYYSCFKGLSTFDAADMLHCSVSMYYKVRRQALVCFAGLWPVKGQELLVGKVTQ